MLTQRGHTNASLLYIDIVRCTPYIPDSPSVTGSLSEWSMRFSTLEKLKLPFYLARKCLTEFIALCVCVRVCVCGGVCVGGVCVYVVFCVGVFASCVYSNEPFSQLQ